MLEQKQSKLGEFYEALQKKFFAISLHLLKDKRTSNPSSPNPPQAR